MSIDFSQAVSLVKEDLARVDSETYYSYEYDGCDIMPELTKEMKNGWLFFSQSRKFIESQKRLDANGIDTLTGEDENRYNLLGAGPTYVSHS
jgi:hypothetical protein